MFKKSWKDAKKVVSRGNMFMLAIGMLLGAAFGAVVKSLANDVIMGGIAKAFGYKGVAFMSYGTTKWEFIKVPKSLDTFGDKTDGLIRGLPLNGVMYGKFLSALIGFIIVVIFILVGLMIVYLIINYRNRNKAAAAPAGPSVDEQILAELKILNNANAPKTTSTKASKETKTEDKKEKEEKKPTVKKAITKKPAAKKAPAKKATTAKKPAAKKPAAKKAPAKK